MIVDYDSATQNSNGSYTATNVSGSVTDPNGALSAITGLYDQNLGKQFFITSNPSTDSIFDNTGLAFNTSSGTTYEPLDLNANGPAYPKSTNPPNYYFASTGSSEGTFSVTSQSPVCYCTGTLIRTVRGDVVVEELAVGDLVVTGSGEHRPVRWIGHRTIDCTRHPEPSAVLPVRIAAGALGENRPARDLVVSPGHAIGLDILGEVLVPAAALVNGTTIVHEDVDSVTYWHVELDSHDLLIAEGQPAESYLDMGNRSFFAHHSGANAVIALTAGPDADPSQRTHADYCRPFHDGGPLVDVLRAQLRRRAEVLGWRLEQPETWAEAYLEVDGQIVRPKARGLSACFVLPADAREVFLVSPTSVPRDVEDSRDPRSLGLCLAGLKLDDGLNEPRVVALDEPLLSEGFHALSPDHRWTAGRARIPAELLAGLEGSVFLRVDLNVPALPRWVAPERSPIRETIAADESAAQKIALVA
ncbi:hypothetical protein MFUR16E_21670 [Methylobacterium fujisawaense]